MGLTKLFMPGSYIIFNPSVSGGFPPYTYAWGQSGNALSCLNCQYPSVTLSQNSTYIVTVTDSHGTAAMDTINYTISGNTNLLQSNLTNTNIYCFHAQDSTTVAISNGTSPYTFYWGDGSSDAGNSPGLHVYSQAGIYVFSVSDALGCVTSAFDTILNQALTVTAISAIQPNCIEDSTGKIVLAVSGGTAPYSYHWVSGQTTDSITGISAGDYYLTVTDVNSCSTQFDYNLTPLHDVWSYYIFESETDANCSNNGTITTDVYGGNAPYTYFWNNAGTTQNLQGLGAGDYSVTVTDAVGCARHASATVNFTCISYICGSVFIDSNQNCIFDSIDLAVPNVSVIAQSGNQYYYGYTDINGHYSIVVPDTGNYYVTISEYGSVCSNFTLCGNQSQIINLSGLGDSLLGNNFAATNASGFDLTMHPGWTSADPGFQKEYWVMPYNQSIVPYDGQAIVVFNYDSSLIYQYSYAPMPIWDSVAHSLTWLVSNLPSPFYSWDSVRFQTFFLVPTTVGIGQLLNSTFTITPTSGDCDSSNNVMSFSETCIGSHDPNEKTVVPANTSSPDNPTLTYTIHFQNTGTDSTWFIVVTDTLDANLDPSSVRNIASSNPYFNFTITGKGALTWTFNPLRLVDSITNARGSQGFITFSVNKRPDLPLGTTISNKAYVYFDYNSAVITNTVSDTVAVPTSVKEIQAKNAIEVKAYPNPFSQKTHIVVQGVNTKYGFELYDITGRLKKLIPSIGNNEFDLNRDDLSAGLCIYTGLLLEISNWDMVNLRFNNLIGLNKKNEFSR